MMNCEHDYELVEVVGKAPDMIVHLHCCLCDCYFVIKGRLEPTTTYEVVYGGKEHDNPEDSSEMEPRESEYFESIEEARVFAMEKLTEEHPRVWIEKWRTGGPFSFSYLMDVVE